VALEVGTLGGSHNRDIYSSRWWLTTRKRVCEVKRRLVKGDISEDKMTVEERRETLIPFL